MNRGSGLSFFSSLGVPGLLGTFGLHACQTSSSRASNLMQKVVETRLGMGTYITITACNPSKSLLDDAVAGAFALAAEAESIFSRHVADSPVGILNARGYLSDAPAELTDLLRSSVQLALRTDYGFNPAVLPVLEALSAYQVPSVTALPQSVTNDLHRITDPRAVLMEGSTVRLQHANMGISLDGIAKGYIVDQIAATLVSQGVTSFLIDAGGDIRVGPDLPDGKAWNIGVQDAANPGRIITAVSVRSGAIATSGNYESLAVRGYEHLVPVQSKSRGERYPACTSVCVTAPTCTEADSLATALFAMGIERGSVFLASHPAYGCLWQTTEGMISSPGWNCQA